MSLGWIEPRDAGGYAVTEAGAQALTGFGLDGAAWQRRTSAPSGANCARVAYGCIDWSERRDHPAGPFAVALFTHFVERGWLRKQPGDRALEWTPTVQQALGSWVRLSC